MGNVRKRQLKKAAILVLGQLPKLVYKEIKISSDNKTLHSAKIISPDPKSFAIFGVNAGLIKASMKLHS